MHAPVAGRAIEGEHEGGARAPPLLLSYFVGIVVRARLVTAALRDGFGSRVNFAPSDESSRPRLAVLALAKRSFRPTIPSCARDEGRVLLYDFLSSLCGLCIGHALFEHLSGIVFVPSIIKDPHSLQMAPVGFALIAFLHSGYREHE